MPKRLHINELKKEVELLSRDKSALEMKLTSLNRLQETNGYHLVYLIDSNRYNGTCYISRFHAFVEKAEGKVVPKWKSIYDFNGTVPFKVLTDKFKAKFEGTVDVNGRQRGDYEVIREAEAVARHKIYDLMNKYKAEKEVINKKIAKIQSKIYTVNGRKNNHAIGMSLRDKILEGSEESVSATRYCTSTGREIQVAFQMIKNYEKTSSYGRRWMDNVKKEPQTFMEIGMAKMEGFMFYSNWKKLSHGMNKYYTNIKTKIGVLNAANTPGATQEIIDAAQKYRDRMGDNLFYHYLDSKVTGSGKTKEIYILNLPPKIDKQKFRGRFKGADRKHKEARMKQNVIKPTQAVGQIVGF